MKSNVYFVTAHSITLRLGFNTRAYITGLALYRSCSSNWRRTVSRREAERTEISSRVMARGPLPLVAAGSPEATASRSLTSGRLFFRCRTPLSSPCSATAQWFEYFFGIWITLKFVVVIFGSHFFQSN